MVEFALMFPFLALLLFAIIQYGFIFGAQATLRHAAQVTSRTMALPGADYSTAPTVACSAINSLLDCSKLSAVATNASVGGLSTDAVQVNLTYNLPLIIRFVVPNATGNTLTLRAQAVDRKN
jgi:Flp pilus assembly protein TadG